MPNIEDLTKVSTSTPEQAASNIQNASLFALNPVADKAVNARLSPEAEQLLKPTEASPSTKDYMAQSTEHTALATPHVPHLNFMDETAKYVGDIIYNRPTDDQKIVELSLKKMGDPSKFSDEDNYSLWQLNQDRAERAKNDYGKEPPSFPRQVGEQVLEMGRGLRRNAPLIGAFTGAGAAIGALPTAGVGALPGALTGFGYGVTASFMKDTYDSMTGGTYNELSNLTKPDGTPMKIDEGTKAGISRGVGVVSGALMGVLGHTLAKTTPFLNNFVSPAMAKNLILNPTNAAIAKTIMNIGEATAVGGGAGGLVEATRIVAEEMGKTYDGTEASFLNALTAAGNNLKENAARVKDAMLLGGGTAAAIAGTTGALGFNKTKAAFEQRKAQTLNEMSRRSATTRDVTPGEPGRLEAGASGVPGSSEGPQASGPGGPEKSIGQAVKVLQLHDAMSDMNTAAQSTKMAQLAPGEVSSFMQKVFARAGITKLYITMDSLRAFATDPVKGEAARNLIDPSGVAAGQMNAPLEVEPHKFMEIALKHPDILDHVQVEADGPNKLQAEQHLKSLHAAETQRQEVLTKLGIAPQEVQPTEKSNVIQMPAQGEKVPYDLESNVRRADEILTALKDEKLPAAKQTKLNAELADIKDGVTKHYLGESGKLLIGNWDEPDSSVAKANYLNEPTFTEAIKKALPKAEVEKFDTAQMKARGSVAEHIHETALHEMDQVRDIQLDEARDLQLQTERDRIVNDPNYALVDRFRRDQVGYTKGNKKKSIYAIDPKTLTDDLLHYTDDARLKEHKVFAKGGITADESAAMLGIENGEELLKILSKTPTREQVIKARVAANDIDLAKQAADSVDLNHTAITQAFNNRTAAHLAEMKFMREQEWPATKSGIKRIALPLPKIEELTNKAKQAVKQTRVGSLNPTQFKVGERRSQRIAVNAILKNEVEKAFVAKENAALNSEMLKETHLAIGHVNRALKFARKFNDPGTMQELKDAGALYLNAATEILDVFNLNASKKGQAELGSFQKWMKREIERGRGNFSIPERLSDVRQSVNEMTVEQLLLVTDRLRAVLHEAKFKNQLFTEQAKREQAQTIERVAVNIQNLVENHPGHDKARIPSVQDTKPPWENMRKLFSDLESLFTTNEHILRELDQGKLGGYFQEMFQHALKGDGKFDKISGYSKELEMTKVFKEHIDKLIKIYGKSDFDRIEQKILDIPEFHDIAGLNNGRLTKGDLMVLWAYGGDPYTKEKRLNNNGISHEIAQTVFDRELSDKDVDLMQSAVDMYKAYRAETEKLQKETTGQSVTFVEGIPNIHRNRVLPGGYLPAKYRHDYTAAAAKATTNFLKGKKAAFFEAPDYQTVSEQTEQGRLIERTDSDKPLDLSLLRFFRGHEEAIHDLSYRRPVLDALALYRDPRIAKAIISVVGQPKFDLLVGTTIEIANQAQAINANYFSDQNRLIKNLYGHLKNNFNVTVLGVNLTSTAIQYESLTQLVQNMGFSAPKHLAAVNAQMVSHPHLFAGFYNFAVDLDPTIGHFLEGLQNKLSSVVHDVVPKKSSIPALAPLKAAHELATHAMMSPMSLADIHLKVMGAMAGYRQFMAGDVEGFPIEKILAMPEKERYAKAQAYVRQLSRLSLTHGRPEDKAPFQKTPLTDFFANYWNDLRNVLNNEISQGRKTKWGSEEAYDKYQTGDYSGAKQAAVGVAGIVMMTIVTSTLGRIYSDRLRGFQQTPLDWNVDLKSAQGIKEAAEKMGYYMMMSPIDQMIGITPIVKDVNWAANTRRSATKVVQLPITKTLSDFATAAAALGDLLTLSKHPSKVQQRAIMNSLSYLMLPIPVNAYSKLTRYLESNPKAQSFLHQGQIDRLQKQLDGYIKNPPDTVPKDFVAHLKDLHAQLAPQNAVVPTGTADSIKTIESGGDWTKPNGLYGFTAQNWKSIMRQAPELGLTENGRTAKNSAQQEKAIDWSLHSNAIQLADKDIPVNAQTLFGAHRLGIDDYVKVFKAPADTKLKTVLSSEVLNQHPELANFKTIGQVKSYFSGLSRNDNNLTSKTSQNED